MPTNKRNRRSYSSRSIRSRSGGIEGCSIGESSAAKSSLESHKRRVHDLPDLAQRVIPPNPRLKIDIAEKFARSIVATTPLKSSQSRWITRRHD